MKLRLTITSLLLLVVVNHKAQNINNDTIQQTNNQESGLNLKSLIIPTVLIGYGVAGINSDRLQLFNIELKDEITEHVDEKKTIDDFSQYSPIVAVYALNAFGIKGKNNFKDRTILICTAYLIMATTVNSLKYSLAIERPDRTGKNSFPSGHTATAFMSAEFLYQEYKDKSIWYGIAGYTVAAGTGFLRLHNDRHWFTDVVAGAGIGMLSTKIAYWTHPWIKRNIFPDRKGKSHSMAMPYIGRDNIGVSLTATF